MVEMGSESSVNSGISEVSFHHAEFAFSAAFPSIKLNSLALYCLKFALVCSIPVDISNNPRILEIYDGVVNEESGCRGRMENIEVIIFDPRSVEIGSGMCVCMKGNRELRVALLADPYKVSINPNLPESDITCHLILPILIEEDKRVLPCITTVVLAPSSSWMVWVIKLLSELRDVGDGTRCG